MRAPKAKMRQPLQRRYAEMWFTDADLPIPASLEAFIAFVERLAVCATDHSLDRAQAFVEATLFEADPGRCVTGGAAPDREIQKFRFDIALEKFSKLQRAVSDVVELLPWLEAELEQGYSLEKVPAPRGVSPEFWTVERRYDPMAAKVRAAIDIMKPIAEYLSEARTQGERPTPTRSVLAVALEQAVRRALPNVNFSEKADGKLLTVVARSMEYITGKAEEKEDTIKSALRRYRDGGFRLL